MIILGFSLGLKRSPPTVLFLYFWSLSLPFSAIRQPSPYHFPDNLVAEFAVLFALLIAMMEERDRPVKYKPIKWRSLLLFPAVFFIDHQQMMPPFFLIPLTQFSNSSIQHQWGGILILWICFPWKRAILVLSWPFHPAATVRQPCSLWPAKF